MSTASFWPLVAEKLMLMVMSVRSNYFRSLKQQAWLLHYNSRSAGPAMFKKAIFHCGYVLWLCTPPFKCLFFTCNLSHTTSCRIFYSSGERLLPRGFSHLQITYTFKSLSAALSLGKLTATRPMCC